MCELLESNSFDWMNEWVSNTRHLHCVVCIVLGHTILLGYTFITNAADHDNFYHQKLWRRPNCMGNQGLTSPPLALNGPRDLTLLWTIESRKQLWNASFTKERPAHQAKRPLFAILIVVDPSGGLVLSTTYLKSWSCLLPEAQTKKHPPGGLVWSASALTNDLHSWSCLLHKAQINKQDPTVSYSDAHDYPTWRSVNSLINLFDTQPTDWPTDLP